jgi:hypothetical protein
MLAPWKLTAFVPVAFAMLLLCLGVLPSAAQDASKRPPRTTEAVEALERAEWQVLRQGLRYVKTSTALGTYLSAFEISLDSFRLEIVASDQPDGRTAKGAARADAAVLAVNGGFFSVLNGKLKPVGMISVDGKRQGNAWTADGGYLVTSKPPRIVPSGAGVPKDATDFIQSKPVLIEPGGIWAMNTNQSLLEHRTAFCLKGDGKAVLLTVSGGGLSLFETGWLLRNREWGGFFDCDSAIALDGGGSTQLHVPGHPDLDIEGQTKVHNFLTVVDEAAGAGTATTQ